jgi:CubicO group peptidase (beta-lactamase class C family)
MSIRGGLPRKLTWLFCIASALGCGGQPRQLHALSGNDFTLFPEERWPPPPPITCTGDTEERFACFSRELESKTKGLDVAGALALVTPDGTIRAVVRGDSLNPKPPGITEDTRFPAASVTKMFVAASTVSLSLDGALDLRQPISRYLPERGDAGVGRATLHQLLTHTSGLGNPPLCDTRAADLADVALKHGTEPLLAPPGAVSNYSNMGYSFVALVLERVTGKPFEQVVRERVLLPVGIPGASFGPSQVTVVGHRPEGVDAMPRCRAMWPAGGLVLSVRELARWAHDQAHPDDSKLGRPLIALLTAPHALDDARPGRAYGYGVSRTEQSGVTVFSHTGGLEDFSSFVAWAPERQLGVAAFSNRSDLAVVGAGLRAMSTFLSLSADWRAPPGAAHPPSAYTGIYFDDAGTLGRLRVSLEGERLVIDYLDGKPPLLPATFHFVFDPGALHAHYVVTPVGVGQRLAD